MNAEMLAEYQPAKLAAMESHWDTSKSVPLNLLQWPDVSNERNAIQSLPVPKLLSVLAFYKGDAEIKGLKEFPREVRPPVMPSFISFRIMVGIGSFLLLICFWAWMKRKTITDSPLLLKIIVWCIPLPYIACQTGWTLAEVGRQPWIVYGLMKTSEGASTLAVSQVATSTIALILLYSLLGIADFYLLIKYARKGPKSAPAIAAPKAMRAGR
jgi:cytochrome d ubiquinol oxidase subunit I